MLSSVATPDVRGRTLSTLSGQLFLNILVDSMRLLWLIFVLHTALAQPGFGRSYLRNSRLCHGWSCVNTKLGLPDALPERDEYAAVVKSLLPEGARDIVDTALDVCYGIRSRRYTNTCPGQALMHCLYDQFIEHCPEESLRKDDACSPISSIAGLKYMFSQSLYENMEKHLPQEHRPVWFLKNYFKSKCCHIPPLFNSTVLTECGFRDIVQYYTHAPQYETTLAYPMVRSTPIQAPPVDKGEKVQVVDLNDVTEPPKDVTDPLDCCNINEFIKPAWRSECQFELTWNNQFRLSMLDKPAATTLAPSTTSKPARERDIMVVPQSCEQETCIFKKLNIISDSGTVDMDAFLKLLDNFTDSQPTWMKAKARVVTACLTKPLRDYDAECEINKVLACTFDVLTENCPLTKKINLCKHSKDHRVCQISSSKSRPKHRRDTCFLPEIVSRDVLTECGLRSLTRVEQAPETPVVNKNKNTLLAKYSCIDQTQPTACLMGKMGVLSRYGFMDHFQMKDRIRQFSTGFEEWKPWTDVYLGAFTNIPMYRDYCNSPKKLLNLLDAMVMTCPVSRRKDTPQCHKIFTEMTHSIPIHEQNVTNVKLDRILNHFHHVFWPASTQNNHRVPQKQYKIVKKPIYDYGILKSKNVPTIQIINVKPDPKKPLVLVPVYMRLPAQTHLSRPHANNSVWRSNPFWLHNRIAEAHLNSTTVSPNPSVATKTTITVA